MSDVNPHGSPLEQALVVAWKRWERSPEERQYVEEVERVLDAFCEGEDIATHELHDKITKLRRNRVGIEYAVRIAVAGMLDG